MLLRWIRKVEREKMSKQELKQKGFTIIEVVLVLAIAALIFLMVFIALPALQRNQRDTQRRQDAGRFVSQLSSYATNNKGRVPTTAAELTSFKTSYLKWAAGATGEYNDPKTGVGYVVTQATAATTAPANVGDMVYAPGYTCNGEALQAAGARQAAVVVKLEGSGNNCQNT